MHKANKLVYGIGTKGNTYQCNVGRKLIREYTLWSEMLRRCAATYQEKHPTYTDTACSESFKSFTFFYEWCNKQVGFKSVDEKGNYWQLDKDLLIKGNKLYSEDTCVFVPQRVNKLLTRRDKSRGKHPLGVCWNNWSSKFSATCSVGEAALTKHIGYFDTPIEAFVAYKSFKEAYIKEVANEYKHQLDPRAYEALINYQVEETD